MKVKEMEKEWTRHALEFNALALQDPPKQQPRKGKDSKPSPDQND